MLIFAIISIPAMIVYLSDNISYKEIVLYFSGMVTCQIISVIMWSLGTFYSYNSDILITKAISYIINGFIPLLVPFIVAGIFTDNKSSKFRINDFFIYGYLHWHLLFRLFYAEKFANNPEVIYLPFLYLVSIYIYSYVKDIEFKKEYHQHKILKFVFPVLIFIGVFLSMISGLIMLVSLLASATLFYFMIKKLYTK